MKLHYKIFTIILIILAVFISCKKDQQIPTTPFVEYRNIFTGTYIGILYKTPVSLSQASGSTTPIPNYSLVITKSITNDSAIFVSISGLQITISANGTSPYGHFVAWPNHYLKILNNDSAIFQGDYGGASSGYSYNFNGKKL